MLNANKASENRTHGKRPVDRKTSKANIDKLEYLVEDFKRELAEGGDLLELYEQDFARGSRDFRDKITGATVPDGYPSARSIESLLDRANVPTMSRERYFEIEAWWDGICEKARTEEDSKESNEPSQPEKIVGVISIAGIIILVVIFFVICVLRLLL
jgi:hypothetical protein